MHKPRQRTLGRCCFLRCADAFEADLMLPQIAEIILVKKPLIDAETKLGKKHFPGVGRERGAAHPAHAVLLATNHETVEMKVALT